MPCVSNISTACRYTNVSTVVDPAVKFTWIQQHWDEEEIAEAQNDIFETVSPVMAQVFVLYANAHKMRHYRVKKKIEAGTPPVGQRLAANTIHSLAAHLGLLGLAISALPEAQGPLQTVEEEFYVYSREWLQDENNNAIKYWEVSCQLCWRYIIP